MLAVTTKKLTKKFGRITALNELNLNIKEGEIYGLIGPNGSGKTTAIKILCGLLHQTSGSISILGQTMLSKEVLNKIGYMPQETAIYLDNTVHENLQFFGEIYGMPKVRLEKREQEMLKFVELLEWRDSLVSNLSGGMKHRVSLACALVHEPNLIFLDEPTVGVDPELRDTFWKYFRKLVESGVTVVITTHYMDEANNCSRVGFLRHGKLIAEGEPSVLQKSAGAGSLEDTFLALVRGKNL
jgi:ABC-2 type transport system ATP-binding protein